MPTPYISFVVASRNDTHGINIQERTQSFLSSLAEQCHRHKLHAELVFVEWNPPVDRKPLSTIFTPPLPSEYFSVRFITVPSHIHDALDNSDKFPFFQMIAKNVGVRRAKGEFVLVTNIDIIFSEELIDFFAAHKLDKGCQYRIDRFDLGVTSLPQGLYGKDLIDFCIQNTVRIQGRYGTHLPGEEPASGPPDRLHSNACGDFALMSRSSWMRMRGYPEFNLFSMYLDGLGIHAAHAIGLRQVIFQQPFTIFHIEHTEGWVLGSEMCKTMPTIDYSAYELFCKKMIKTGKPLSINTDNWGYADHVFEESSFTP